MQIILWLLSIYCAVRFILFSDYVLEGIQYYFRDRSFSKFLLTLMYIGSVVVIYTMVLDYVKEEDVNNLSNEFWMWFIVKMGSIGIIFGWFYSVGKVLLREQDKIRGRIFND